MLRAIRVAVLGILLGSCSSHEDAQAAPKPEHSAGSDEPSPLGRDTLSHCLLRGRRVSLVGAEEQAGDTQTGSPPRTFHRFPPPYADGADWFVAKDLISFQGRRYIWNGPRAVLFPTEVQRVGEFRGVPLYAERTGTSKDIGILLVPVHPGCEFQQYYYFNDTGPIRGDSAPATS